MKYVALGVIAIGAIISYLSKRFYLWIKKQNPEEKELVKIKLAGFGVMLIGLLILLITEKA